MQKILKETASAKSLHLRSTLMIVENASDIDQLVADWVDLAGRVPAHSMSQTAEFAGIALDLAAQQGKECFIITVRLANKLVGVWGLVKSRRWIHCILEPFSCGTHEEMSSPLIEPQFDNEIAAEIIEAAMSIKADRLCFYNMPRSGAVDRAVERLKYFQRVDFIQSYLIDKNSFPNWKCVESRLSKSFRSQLKRYEKKLSERGMLEFGWSRTAEDAASVLGFIYETKRAWLKRKSLRSHWLSKNEVRDFFNELIRKPGFGQSPIIGWIKLDGNPIAGGIYISTENCVEALITTFDPRYSDVSCGNILVKHGISLSLETGRSYDIGIGSARYKERWPAAPRLFTTRIVMRSSVGMIPGFAELKGMLRALRNRLLRRANNTLPEHRGE
jgi:CelD/BcsL family acetyltransferase involved in cellulose biosynthesis